MENTPQNEGLFKRFGLTRKEKDGAEKILEWTKEDDERYKNAMEIRQKAIRERDEAIKKEEGGIDKEIESLKESGVELPNGEKLSQMTKIEKLNIEKMTLSDIIKNAENTIDEQIKIIEELETKKSKIGENTEISNNESVEEKEKENVTEKEEPVNQEQKPEVEVAPEIISPEKIEDLEKLLGNLELDAKNKLESGPLSSRIKGEILKGLNKWENFGKGEEGIKGFSKKFTKMAVNLALIGAISSISVERLANAGIGTASALSGGVTSYLGRKMAVGLGIGGAMELGGKKIPDKIKKWMPVALGIAGVTTATILSGGLAGVAAGASAGVGYLSSKYIKGNFTNEKIAEKEERAKQEFSQKLNKLISENKIDTSHIEFIENDYRKILKKYENQRIWGKILDGATKLGVGSLVSGISMEGSGIAHNHLHPEVTSITHNMHTQEVDGVTGADVHYDPSIKHEYNINLLEKAENNVAVADMTRVHLANVPDIKELDIQNMPMHDIHNVPHEIIGAPNNDIIVHKGEGIESTFIRQIQNNHELAKELGYKGDLNDLKELHKFAGHEAHVIAIKEGYVDNNGHEVRVAEADKIGYEIKNENGHIIVTEKSIDGKILETHHEGDKFESTPDKGEYIKNHEVKVEHNTDQSELPKHIDLKTEEHSIDTKIPPQSHPETNKPIVDIKESTHNLRGQILLNKSGDEVITTRPLEGLTINDLHQVYVTFHDNINHLFPTDKLMGDWNLVKVNVPADRLMEMYKQGQIDLKFNPLIEHIKKLEELTGFKPESENMVLGKPAESITHFINRAMEKIQLEGKLDKIKL